MNGNVIDYIFGQIKEHKEKLKNTEDKLERIAEKKVIKAYCDLLDELGFEDNEEKDLEELINSLPD